MLFKKQGLGTSIALCPSEMRLLVNFLMFVTLTTQGKIFACTYMQFGRVHFLSEVPFTWQHGKVWVGAEGEVIFFVSLQEFG